MNPTLAHPGNSFDLLRLAAALMVVVGHAYPLAGQASPALAGNSIQALGVKIFFVISGFLIMGSWQRDPSVRRFAWRRALRILPGLAGVTVACALGLGLAVTELPWRDYLSNARLWHYFSNLAFYPQYDLPAVFAHNTYPTAVNGSLWSLPAEVAMYVVGPLAWAGGALLLRSARWGVALACLGLALSSILALRVFGMPPVVIYGTALSSFLDVAPYFLLGALYTAPVLQRRLNPWVAIVALVLLAAMAPHFVASEVLLYLVLPYGALSLGLHASVAGQWLAERGDISYGVYLYGFPVQQLVSHWMAPERHTPWTNTTLALPLILLLAVASWRLIERPCLQFKPSRSAESKAAWTGVRSI